MDQKLVQKSWEGDVYQDMITYRFIELSISCLEMALEQEADLWQKYTTWVTDAIQQKASLTNENQEIPKPIILYDFSPAENSQVQIFAIPNENEFFTRFKTDEFEVSVSLSYDPKRMDIRAARIVMFTGMLEQAISWAEALRETLDDLLVAHIQQNG